MEVHQSVDIFKTIQVSNICNNGCVSNYDLMFHIGLCNSSTVTGIIIGVVTFIIGVALGVLLTFLILRIYIHLNHKPSLHPVHAPKQSNLSGQSMEYQDVRFKPATTIPVTQNTAYGRGGRALDKGSKHKGIELDENVAYGSN